MEILIVKLFKMILTKLETLVGCFCFKGTKRLP